MVTVNATQWLLDWQKITAKTASHDTITRFVLSVLEECQVRKTEDGVIDLTFICSKNGDDVKFVLKFTSPADSANTLFCCHLLRHLGVQVPTIYSYSPGTEIEAKIESRMKNVHDVPRGTHNLLFMEAFPGANLTQLIGADALFHLNREDWGKALASFGKMSVFDLMLANHDRFYSPEAKGDFAAVLPICNSGNVMLEIPISENGSRTLKEIYYIDNCSFPDSPPKPDEKRFLGAFTHFYQNQKQLAAIIFDSLQGEMAVRINKVSDAAKELFTDQEFGAACLQAGIEAGYKTIKEASDLVQVAEEYAKKNDQEGALNKVIELIKSCVEVLK